MSQNLNSLDPSVWISLANCSMSCSISSTSLFDLRFILWSRWDRNVISGLCHSEKIGIATDLIPRMHLRMASLRPFKTTLVTKWVLCTLHMVQLSQNTSKPQHTDTIYNS